MRLFDGGGGCPQRRVSVAASPARNDKLLSEPVIATPSPLHRSVECGFASAKYRNTYRTVILYEKRLGGYSCAPNVTLSRRLLVRIH